MTTRIAHGPNTLLEALVEHLRACDYTPGGATRPAAILWTDPRGQWRPLTDALLAAIPELLVLGGYNPDSRTGPAIWLRCMIDGAIEERALPSGHVPIIYLPGVARQQLRAGEECPAVLKPLVELMFRGTLWLQHNGSDWGVTTFLTSTKTLNLDIAKDGATTEAPLRALPELALTPLSQLGGRHLEADDFDRMLSSDVIRDVLRWMGDPAGTRVRLEKNGWGAFCARCREVVSKTALGGATPDEIASGYDDGVRLNIRPFMSAELRRGGKKGAGLLRWKPNVKWKKERGKEPQSLRPKADFPWFWGCPGEGTPDDHTDFTNAGDFDGNRWNDLHYTIAAKQAAREAKEETA